MPDFYIGRQQNGFLYRRTNGRVNNRPVYKCVRGSDPANRNRLYYLFTERGGRLIAMEDEANAANPVENGVLQFRSVHPIDNVEQDGYQIEWQQHDTTTNPPSWGWNQNHWVTFAQGNTPVAQ